MSIAVFTHLNFGSLIPGPSNSPHQILKPLKIHPDTEINSALPLIQKPNEYVSNCNLGSQL